MRKFVAIGPALVVFLAAAAILFAGPAAVRQMIFASTTAEVMLARQSLDSDDILARIDRAITNVAASVSPSIVHIEVAIGDPNSFSPFGSSGAGWVYDTEGHIITNAHVVSRAETIRVEFADGRTMMGKLVASDSFTDIAVVQVDPGTGLIPMRRATGQSVSVGERVFAFGSPFNFKFSMSEGIVSGLGRNPETRGSGNTFTNYIQTDAAVNPGNSGGPLVDIRGEIIGMNVAIATGRDGDGNREGQSAGISFAIPLTVIESVVDQIVRTGEVRRGFLGIREGRVAVADPIFGERGTSEIAIKDAKGNFHGMGVLVGSVTRDQAADRAGIEENDIISEIDGNRITRWHQLRSIVTTAKPDSVIHVKVWREGEEIEIPVSLEQFPEVTLYEERIQPALFQLGLALMESDHGVYVARLDSRWGAAKAGFERGQYIQSIDGEPVPDMLSVYSVLGRSEFIYGEPIDFVVTDDEGETKTLTLRVNR